MSTTQSSPETASATDERARFVQGLRKLADFIEQTPGVPVPGFDTTINVPVYEKGDLAAFARVAGTVAKDYSEHYFTVRKTFGSISYDVFASRETVCQRVQIGTETRRVPDPEKLAELPMVTVEEPVYEWQCDEPILAAAKTGDDR